MTGGDDPLFRVRNLRVSFGRGADRTEVVRGLDFAVGRQEVLAIVGESGSGKSVSMMSMLGLVPAVTGVRTEGEAIFDGQDLLALPPAGRKMRSIRGGEIGFVFQEPMSSLNPVLTVGDQIAETLIEHSGLTPKQAAARACDLMKRVGIGNAAERLNAYPHEFSGGMRQRIMIAIAVACDPRLVIADEPTTALDVTMQAQVLDLLASMVKELGASLILVTHNLGIVARYADRVMTMYAGEIVEIGDTASVFRQAAHPYTAALMACVPRLGNRTPVAPIPGQAPDMADLPEGCSFRPRCGRARAACTELATLRPAGPGRQSACHFAGELTDAG